MLDNGPFVIFLQQTEVAAVRKNVSDYVLGPSFSDNYVSQTKKN